MHYGGLLSHTDLNGSLSAGLALIQDARGATAAAAAAAVVREATASAVMDVLEGESEEEKAAKHAAAKETRMRKVIR